MHPEPCITSDGADLHDTAFAGPQPIGQPVQVRVKAADPLGRGSDRSAEATKWLPPRRNPTDIAPPADRSCSWTRQAFSPEELRASDGHRDPAPVPCHRRTSHALCHVQRDRPHGASPMIQPGGLPATLPRAWYAKTPLSMVLVRSDDASLSRSLLPRPNPAPCPSR